MIFTKKNVSKNIFLEYLLGENVLVAPIVDKGKVTRDVYLPKGSWRDGNDEKKTYKGQQWIRNYKAPLDVLPYFIREK